MEIARLNACRNVAIFLKLVDITKDKKYLGVSGTLRRLNTVIFP